MPLQPCLLLPPLPRAQAAGTHPSCPSILPAQTPSWQTAPAAGRQLELSLHSAALPHMQQLCSPPYQHFCFHHYPPEDAVPRSTGTSGQEWGESQLLSQSLTKGHSKLRWDLGCSHGHKETSVPHWWPSRMRALGETALTGCVERTSDRASTASTATGSPLVLGYHRLCR